ncbi:hypothetical protein ACGFSI_33445 [Streptomyces virginiae]|uniref:hypothetical protein n=1 Tax=Streptomyces virginiae TaxID=1961 RepID=UPI003712BA91
MPGVPAHLYLADHCGPDTVLVDRRPDGTVPTVRAGAAGAIAQVVNAVEGHRAQRRESGHLLRGAGRRGAAAAPLFT